MYTVLFFFALLFNFSIHMSDRKLMASIYKHSEGVHTFHLKVWLWYLPKTVFGSRKVDASKFKFVCNGENLEVVHCFKYLGITMRSIMDHSKLLLMSCISKRPVLCMPSFVEVEHMTYDLQMSHSISLTSWFHQSCYMHVRFGGLKNLIHLKNYISNSLNKS